MQPMAQGYVVVTAGLSDVWLSLQILFHSINRQYFLTNLPWLIGSLG